MLFEAAEGSQSIEQLDVAAGLLQIHNPAKPYITIAIGNNTKHNVTVPPKTVLGTIQHIERVVDTDLSSEPLSPTTVNEVTAQPSGSTPSLWHPSNKPQSLAGFFLDENIQIPC